MISEIETEIVLNNASFKSFGISLNVILTWVAVLAGNDNLAVNGMIAIHSLFEFGQKKSGSRSQVDEQPSPSMLFPSSQGSVNNFPSPHISLQQ